MARTYRHLDLDQRRTLFRMVEAGRPVGKIAARLGRHPSTIHRELGRNRFRDGDRGFCGYFPLNAQDLARWRRRKLAMNEGLREHVTERLKSGWSPQQIAGRLKQEADGGTAVCPGAPRSRASAGSRTVRRRSRAGRASGTGKRTC